MKFAVTVLGFLVLSLVAVNVPQIMSLRNAARVAENSLELGQLQAASSNYFSDFHRWPRSIHDLTRNPSNIVFIDRVQLTNDAWGGPLLYEPFDAKRGFGRIISYGRDGKPGGSGPDADVERRFGK
jgi:general secretion pathway protein G